MKIKVMKKRGCKSSVSLAAIALLPAVTAFSVTALKKKYKND